MLRQRPRAAQRHSGPIGAGRESDTMPNEQLTLNGEKVATCDGCGAARPEGATDAWPNLDNARCRDCRIAAGEGQAECEECGEPTFTDALYWESYYLSPFDDEPVDSDVKVCLACWDAAGDSGGLEEGLFWCDACNRQISESRGHHLYYRDLEAGRWCLACVEEVLKAEGIAGFEPELEALFNDGKPFGMFFNRGELEAEGWTPAPGFSDYRVAGGEETRALAAAARALHEAGERIIIGYERLSIVGDEGYVTLFSKGPEGVGDNYCLAHDLPLDADGQCPSCDERPEPECSHVWCGDDSGLPCPDALMKEGGQ